MSAPVMIMAGGTGGHVIPALVVAEVLRERGLPVVWLGTRAGIEARLVPAAGIPLEFIDVTGLRGKSWRRWLAAPAQLTRAVIQSLAVLRRRRPVSVLGMGGFVSGPGGLAAWLSGRPLVIHEQNSVPGLTNRLLARFASQVLQAFPDAFPPAARAITVGNPVRRSLLALPPPAERHPRRSQRRVRLLVLGGSLGARSLNITVPAALKQLDPGLLPEIRHQSGARTADEARAAYRQQGVDATLIPFIDDMEEAYAWADLVIARSGASTVAELEAVGLASILVPYPHAVADEQTRNARQLVDAGAAVLLPETELSAERLAAMLQSLLADPERLQAMADAARALRRADAADSVALACLRAAGVGA